MKQFWQAEDGEIFDSEDECKKYEEKLLNEKKEAQAEKASKFELKDSLKS